MQVVRGLFRKITTAFLMSNDVCNGGIQSLCSWGSARKSHHKLSHDILQEEDSCVLPSCDIIPIA